MKLVLLLGTSGVGKTTVLKLLLERNSKLFYVSPHTTRSLRDGEWEKVMVINPDVDLYEAINCAYGNFYCTPRGEIKRILEMGKVPIVDWPLDGVWKLSHHNPLSIYLKPPSLEELRNRLEKSNDGRIYRERDCLAEIWSLEKIDYHHPSIQYVVTSIDPLKTTETIEGILRTEQLI